MLTILITFFLGGGGCGWGVGGTTGKRGRERGWGVTIADDGTASGVLRILL